jgi:hypothetical protein
MSDFYIPVAIRRAVYERAHHCCEYCRNQTKYVGPFSFDHVEPLSKGGETTFENLALACAVCNSYKAALTQTFDPATNEFVSLFNPRTQRWQDHFAWSEDTTLVIGLTPVGRATIGALRLNRSEAVNLRRVLFGIGEHPPQAQF